MSDSGRTGDVFLVVEGEMVTWGVFIRPTRRKVFPLAMMMWIGAVTLAFAASGWAGSPPAKPVDCEVYETDSSSVTVGFKVGNLLLQVGPEITLSKKRGVDWKEPVQKMIARFVEVCTRYNAGVVTKEEYDGRIQEIEDLNREYEELKRQAIVEARAHGDDAFIELDHIFPTPPSKGSAAPSSKKKEPPTVRESLKQLTTHIDDLAPIGKPLKPTKPCPPPDVLGAPGYDC